MAQRRTAPSRRSGRGVFRGVAPVYWSRLRRVTTPGGVAPPKAATGSGTAVMTLTASRTGSRNQTGTQTATLTLTATGTGGRQGARTAAMMLAAVISGAVRASAPFPRLATLNLAGPQSGAARAGLGGTGVATLILAATGTGSRFRVEIVSQAASRRTASYDLVAVARVMSPTGPPTFLQVDPIDWTGLSWTDELSKPAQLQVGCKVSQLTEPVLQRLRDGAALPTELWCYRNGKLVFAGPLRTGQVQGEALTITAVGLLGYADQWIVPVDTMFPSADQFTIVKALVDQWQAGRYGNFGLDTSSISTSGILRQATYLAKERNMVGKTIADMGARDNGFDVTADPASRKLLLDFPQRGVNRATGEDAVVFDERNITSSNIAFSISPDDVATEAYATSTSTTLSLFSIKQNLDLLAKYGRSAVSATFDSITDQATLDAHAQGLLNARKSALLIPGPNARVTVDADIGTYDVGDTVAYSMHEVLSPAAAYRIRKRVVTVDKSGQEAVTLAFV